MTITYMGKRTSNTWFSIYKDRMLVDPEGRSFDLYACGSTSTVFDVSANGIAAALSAGLVVKVGTISAPTTIQGIVPGTFFMLLNTLDMNSNDKVVVF